MLTTKKIKTFLLGLENPRLNKIIGLIETDIFDTSADLLIRGANIITVLIVSAFASALAYLIMAQPGGLVGATGRFLAEIAVNTGIYDFWALMGAFAMTNIWMIGILIGLALSFGTDDDWDMEYIEDQFATLVHDTEQILAEMRRQCDYDETLTHAMSDRLMTKRIDDITNALHRPTDEEIKAGV